MNVTILTLTDRALKLAERIKEKLLEDPTVFSVRLIHRDMDLEDVFRESQMIIGIMATGIMVRKIAPLIRGKLHDPGVIVIDEAGRNVISLLSGHAGGANDFALKIAGLIGANPVITTSTDVNGLIGIDTLAARYFYQISDPGLLKHFNSSIIRGHTVELVSSRDVKPLIDGDAAGTYTYRRGGDENIRATCNGKTMILRPLKVSLGIGTRRGVRSDTILEFIHGTMKRTGIPVQRIDAIATGEMKRNEEGIIRAASILGVPLEFIPLDELKDQETVSFSDFVNSKFGVGSVCESAALKSAGPGSRLIVRKTASSGVALALAVSRIPKTF